MTVRMKDLQPGQVVAYKPDTISNGYYRRHPSTMEGWSSDRTTAAFKAGVWGVPAIVLGVDKWVLVRHACGFVPQTHENAKKSVLLAIPALRCGVPPYDYEDQLLVMGVKCGVEATTEWTFAIAPTTSRLEDWDLWVTQRNALGLAADEMRVKHERVQDANSKLQGLIHRYEAAVHKATIAHFEALMKDAIPADATGDYGTKINISRDHYGVNIKLPSRLVAKLVSLDDAETWEQNIADARKAHAEAQAALECKTYNR